MKAELLKAALEIVPNQGILVNMVSRRVRQLNLGHKPMVEFVPGMQAADIALSEIGSKKLTFELTPGKNGKNEPRNVIEFFGNTTPAKRAA
ncbi:MAG TPA: DNA-directed RNA polymerase subunit omega [Chthoniobacterales bacterium]|jgi:DNA-directed RNA polymerase subunit K/omega